MQRIMKSERMFFVAIAVVVTMTLTVSLTACVTSNAGRGASGGDTSVPVQSNDGSTASSENDGSASDSPTRRNATSENAQHNDNNDGSNGAGSAATDQSTQNPTNTNSDTTQQSIQDTANYIGLDRAEELATTHAGTTVDQVTFIESRQDYDDGRAEYDIEFVFNNTEYEYEIDAISGTVLSYDAEVIRR